MSSPAAQETLVMLGATLRAHEDACTAVARVIEMAGDIPCSADQPPPWFSSFPAADRSPRMAAACSLYLCVIPAGASADCSDEALAPALQEFYRAREANPYKVRVFLAAQVRTNPQTDALRAFIEENMERRDGSQPHVFASLAELQEQVLETLIAWHESLNNAGKAYLRAVAEAYRAFRSPVTGKEIGYDAIVHPTVRVESAEPPESQTSLALTDVLAQYGHLVITGATGAGKSTLLTAMASEAASGQLPALPNLAPVLVTAAQLGRVALEQPTISLAEALVWLHQRDARYTAVRPTVARTITEAITSGEALLLIDGFDEATAQEQSAALTLLADVGQNLVALASRTPLPAGQLVGWARAEVQPLEPEQQRALVLQVFRLETNVERQVFVEEDTLQTMADDLLADLRGRGSDLAAWPGNPLLLTLLAVQYLRTGRLPENRALIYEFALEDLQRQIPGTARRILTDRELETYLRLLALRMTHALTDETTVAEVRDTYLPGYALSTRAAQEILERSGVLRRVFSLADVPNASDATNAANATAADEAETRYAFVHLSFREYLTACALAGMPEWQRHDLARRHCLHQAWEQALVLLVNRLDQINRVGKADQVIRVLMRADTQPVAALRNADPTHLALRLATQCALSRGKFTSEGLARELQQAWLPVWRREERWLLHARGFIEVLDEIDITAGVDAVPAALMEAMPFLVRRVRPRWRFPSSRWWLRGILVAVACLGLLYLIAQMTLGLGPLHTSNLGRWLDHALPSILLALLLVIAGLRLYGRFAARTRTRGEMVEAALGSDEAARTLKPWSRTEYRFPTGSLVALLRGADTRLHGRPEQLPTTPNLSPRALRRLAWVAARPRGWWLEAPIRFIHWLTDWPVLVALLLAQVALLFPAVTARLPLQNQIRGLLGLTAWWQVLLIALLYLAFGLLTNFLRALIVYGNGRQRKRVATLAALELVIRRQVEDTASKTLARGE